MCTRGALCDIAYHALTPCLMMLKSRVLSRSRIDAVDYFSELRLNTKRSFYDLAAAKGCVDTRQAQAATCF